ncbi:hypothetical protein HJG60_008782 [Phyllostomus discolor]|uniref:Uncharacterized protein n=1 Tax=Phyllostomus discolor TaxID=89673 RepID=A0A833YW92_9CHIR|nr:hypothetical protein HJG60_008782 [Phyllostomus discolor]
MRKLRTRATHPDTSLSRQRLNHGWSLPPPLKVGSKDLRTLCTKFKAWRGRSCTHRHKPSEGGAAQKGPAGSRGPWRPQHSPTAPAELRTPVSGARLISQGVWVPGRDRQLQKEPFVLLSNQAVGSV